MEQSARGVSQINPNEPRSAGVGRITEGPHQMDIHDGYGAATILFYEWPCSVPLFHHLPKDCCSRQLRQGKSHHFR